MTNNKFSEIKEIKELRLLEEKFGIKAYEDFKKILAMLYQQNEELRFSRDRWKEKYFELVKSGRKREDENPKPTTHAKR